MNKQSEAIQRIQFMLNAAVIFFKTETQLSNTKQIKLPTGTCKIQTTVEQEDWRGMQTEYLRFKKWNIFRLILSAAALVFEHLWQVYGVNFKPHSSTY